MESERNVVQLDVRPYLRKKLEPFQIIMEAFQKLEPDQVLVLHATFKPTPLLGLMKMKGYANKVEKLASDHWVTAFAPKALGKAALDGLALSEYRGTEEAEIAEETERFEAAKAPDVPENAGIAEAEMSQTPVKELDNRGLEPPQPMARTLKALETCKPGERVRIHNDRVPMFLLEELKQFGYPYSIEEQPDGSAKVTITRT